MKLRAIRPPITPRSPCFRGLGFVKRSNILFVLQTINGQVFHTFVLSASYLQTYLKLSKSSLFVLSMNLEGRTSPNLNCGWTSLLIVQKRNVFFKPQAYLQSRTKGLTLIFFFSSLSSPSAEDLVTTLSGMTRM